MYEGCIIEYIDQGRFICSVCLQDRGGKLHLLTRLNREVNLSSKRAILISKNSLDTSSTREILLEKLRRADERRIELQSEVKPLELWELIHDEKESFDHRYLGQLVFGDEISDDHISAVVRALFEDRTYFKLKESQFLPNSPERVDELIRQREEDEAREIMLKDGGVWIRDVLKGNPVPPPECSGQVVELLTDAALFGQDASGSRFAAEIINTAGLSTLEDARKILVALGVWQEDENLDILREGIEPHFSEELRNEALTVSMQRIDPDGREDLRDLRCLTVDGAFTRDFDDALSVHADGDELVVGVHVTDVASVIPPGSLLDSCAKDRVSSIYLQRQQVPMLPEMLSENTLSLIEGTDRPAISLLCRFDGFGNLQHFRFVSGIIRVSRQMVYEQVNGLIDTDEDLARLHRIAHGLRRERFSQGALDLTLPDVKIDFNQDGLLTVALQDQDTPSRTIVEEMMVLYNLLAARWCREKGIPTLYRAQAPPSERLSEEEEDRFFYVFQQLRKLSPLQLDTTPKPHSGLGVDIYTQCTSPIRRYLDLVVQRQIKAGIDGTEHPHNAEDLEMLRVRTEPVLRRIGAIKRARLRYWIIKYMSQNPGRVYPVLILSDTKTRFRVLIKDFMMVVETRKQPSLHLLPGQKAFMRVVKADPWKDILELDFTGADNR